MIDEKVLIEKVEEYFIKKQWEPSNALIRLIYTMVSDEVVNLVESQPKINEWIPCKDELPELNKTVMCSNRDGRVFTSELTFRSEDGRFYRFGNHYGVKAWMPLPEPYKGNKP